jgi:hypothetical protein
VGGAGPLPFGATLTGTMLVGAFSAPLKLATLGFCTFWLPTPLGSFCTGIPPLRFKSICWVRSICAIACFIASISPICRCTVVMPKPTQSEERKKKKSEKKKKKKKKKKHGKKKKKKYSVWARRSTVHRGVSRKHTRKALENGTQNTMQHSRT